MTTVNITEPAQPSPGPRLAPFALGFRPFFFLADVSAVLLVVWWLAVLGAGAGVGDYFDPIGWHRHEMIFGFGMAVVAGFLLTAARNWTSRPTPTGAPLAGLVVLWLLGRVMPFLPVPGWLYALVDLSFIPLVALALAIPIWHARQHRNQVFPLILLVLALANAVIHAQRLGLIQSGEAVAAQAALLAHVWIIVVMGGRIIPFFTERAFPGFLAPRRRWLDWLALCSLPVLIVALALRELAPALPAAAALLAALFNTARMSAWLTRRIWSEPLVWVLHLGYAWIIFGLLLEAGGLFGLPASALAVHAYAVGGLGALGIGMMARVALGHTGRAMMLPSPAITWTFALVNIAGAARVLPPLFWPQSHDFAVTSSAILWTTAFVIFMWVYTPILLRARPDGRPG